MLSKTSSERHLNVLSKLIVGFLFAVFIAVAVVSVFQFRNYNTLQSDWHQYQEEPEAKAFYLTQILREAGYSGFIHDFKNLVLRKDVSKVVPLRVRLASIFEAINGYRSLENSPSETRALDSLEETFREYESNLDIALDRIKQTGSSAQEIDAAVGVNDLAAAEALDHLRIVWESMHHEGRTRQENAIEKGEFFILALMVIVPVFLLGGVAIFYLLRSLWNRLADQSRQTASMFESTAEGIITIDGDGTIELFNPAAEALFGYSSAEALGQNVSMLLPESDRADHTGYVQRSNLYETRIINQSRDLYGCRKDGSLFPMELNVSRLSSDTARRFVGVFRDISVRRDAEEALKKSEERFRAFATTASDWLWETDAEHRFSWFSDESIDGRMQSLGKKRWELCDTTVNSQGWAGHIKRHKERKAFDNFEYAIALPGGRQVWVAVSGEPFFSNDGAFMGYRGAARNITSRIENDRLLTQATERFRDFVETASDWVWETDADNRFTQISDKFFDLLDIKPEKILGNSRWDYIDVKSTGLSDAEWAEHRKQMEAHKPFSNFHYQIKGRDGREISISLSGRPHFDEEGSFLGYRGSGTDRTSLASAMDSLKETKNQAEAANAAKSQFLSSMSHELRTPLNAVLGFSQLMDDPENPLSDEQKESLKHITDGGTHLLSLINEILDLAKIESGKTSLSIEPVSCDSIVDPCMVMAQSLGDKYEISVENKIENIRDLPSVICDMTRTKQVLLNLLSNAVKYNRENGQVHLDAEAMGNGMIRFSVADTGSGISKIHLAELFKPFNRLANEKSTIEGTGIGLTITKELVEQMNGQIGVESEEGKGSTFWVELPVAAEEATTTTSTETIIPTALAMATATAQLDRKHQAHYIEDNPANVDLMRMAFKRAPNLELVVSSSAEQGLEAINQTRPDVVLMDIDLPGMSGIEACEHLKSDPSTSAIPVIAVSANAMPHDLEAAENKGFETYIQKPFKVPELLEAISRALENVGDTRPTPSAQKGNGKDADGLIAMLDPTAVSRVQKAKAGLPDRYQEILRNFLGSLPLLQKEMLEALETGDVAALELAAHNYRSHAATLGAMELSVLAMGIERMASAGEVGATKTVFNEIEHEYRRLKPAMEQLVSQ